MRYAALKVHYCGVYSQSVCTSRIVIGLFHTVSIVQWLAKRAAPLYANGIARALRKLIGPFSPDLPEFNYVAFRVPVSPCDVDTGLDSACGPVDCSIESG